MRKHILLLIGILVLHVSTLQVLANGACIASSSKSIGGNINFQHVKEVTLDKEDLYIDIREKEVDVKVVYMLTNTSGEAKVYDYLFPVFCEPGFDGYPEYGEVTNFKMSINDTKTLNYKLLSEKIQDPTVDYRQESLSLEFVSRIAFQPYETIKFIVSYTVPLSYFDYGTSKSPFIGYDDRKFAYDLSPARFWGNGKIHELNIYINTGKVTVMNPEITYTFAGKELALEKGMFDIYQYKDKDVQLTEESLLSIVLDMSSYYNHQDFIKQNIGFNQIKSITTSSTLKEKGYDYSPGNLFDQDVSTVWSEGIKGVGEGSWIEVELLEPEEIACIGFLDGYRKDVESYKNNGKVKSMKIEFYNESPYSDKGEWVELTLMPSILEDKYVGHKNFYIYGIGEHHGEMGWKTKKIRFTIEAAVKGDKYDDTCISEIILMRFEKWNRPEIKENEEQGSS